MSAGHPLTTRPQIDMHTHGAACLTKLGNGDNINLT